MCSKIKHWKGQNYGIYGYGKEIKLKSASTVPVTGTLCTVVLPVYLTMENDQTTRRTVNRPLLQVNMVTEQRREGADGSKAALS